MKLSHEDHNELTIMTLRGELTVEYVDQLRKAALERIEAHIRDFVLDISDLNFIDSKGLEAILWLQEQTSEQLGQIRLAGVGDEVSSILEMTRLAARFECHESVETAIQSLQ